MAGSDAEKLSNAEVQVLQHAHFQCRESLAQPTEEYAQVGVVQRITEGSHFPNPHAADRTRLRYTLRVESSDQRSPPQKQLFFFITKQ